MWRRRKCVDCKEVFTTSEQLSQTALFVIKRNLTRKRFVYEKLFTSLLMAVIGEKGADMGNAAILAKEVAQKVVEDLLQYKSKYISTKDIIEKAYYQLSMVNDFYAKKYAMYSRYRMQVIQGRTK